MKKQDKFNEAFNTTANYIFGENCKEHPKGESVAVKGEGYTIRQLQQRHKLGQTIDIAMKPVYHEAADHESTDMEKLRDSDLYDKEVYAEDNAEKMLELAEIVKKAKAEKLQKYQTRKEFEKKVMETLQKEQQEKTPTLPKEDK